MEFDYCQFEKGTDGSIIIFVGCSFIDEPDELYVIEIHAFGQDRKSALTLRFNGMDCKYSFNEDEKSLLANYIHLTLPGTPFAHSFLREKLIF